MNIWDRIGDRALCVGVGVLMVLNTTLGVLGLAGQHIPEEAPLYPFGFIGGLLLVLGIARESRSQTMWGLCLIGTFLVGRGVVYAATAAPPDTAAWVLGVSVYVRFTYLFAKGI